MLPYPNCINSHQPFQFLLSNQPTHFLFPATFPRVSAHGKCRSSSVSLLFSVKNRKGNGFGVRGSLQSPEEVSDSVGGSVGLPQPYSVKIPVGDRHILVETGQIGRQASGSVTVTDGETIVYTTVCLDDVPSEPTDFFPLSVNYQERFSAAGRTSGGFFKREGKTKDHEVLICRLIDRPLRPTMPKGFYHETQILSWVLSYDGLHCPDSLAVTAAGIAVALSEVPMSKTVAGVRVGLVGDKYIINPTTEEMEHSELDLMLAGTDSAILMIEGYGNFLSEEKLLQAVEVGQDAVREICNAVEALVKKCGKPKMFDSIKLPPPELYTHVEEIAGDELVKALQIRNKIPRRKALSLLEEKVLEILTENGVVTNDAVPRSNAETIAEILEVEDEDEEVIVDGEVDEGDVHIKPTPPKPTPLFSEVDVKLVFKDVTSKFLRKRIVQGGKRSDGRTPSEIRPINSRCGLLPRAHGSALFTRGETQALSSSLLRLSSFTWVPVEKPHKYFSNITHERFVSFNDQLSLCYKHTNRMVDNQWQQRSSTAGGAQLAGVAFMHSISLAVATLGDKQMAQRIDNLIGVDDFKKFYLQYSFPPSCVGEVGRIGAPGRREVGHGMLAERSLEPILPSDDDFPYTIRVESTITESNGSSSMASVCGGCLALQDAGVPIKCSIAGIAMGMVLDTKEFGGDGTPLILSDITGSEDASGDMDFKVAGNEDGITAFQMDIKVGGITLPIMREALVQARNGRKQILGEMMNCSPPPAKRLSKHAPLIYIMKVKPERINLIIGSGGKKVRSIIEECGVEAIDTDDNGNVKIFAKDLASLERSKAIITNLTMVPSIGDIYRNCEIKSITPYGAFVEIAPGREAFNVGDRIDVKLMEINDRGQLRLSHRALLPAADLENSSVEQPAGKLTDDTAASQKSYDKGLSKKDTTSSKRRSEDDSVIPSKKFIRKLVSSSQDKPFTNKDKIKKSSNKAVGSVSGKDESSWVSGEPQN
ncbi:hypothetical protein TanjilG_03825 [Lupinus angustifolius]|uniref:polyribonucleotide nucleotidyltransferase n=1 Tax=Lupinus angustifolius TaxID=3871 RepID=A0A394DE46_LUPAN|nr:hypothetical protein TanjilG_03825 [Lupinus angustifolius]